VVSVPPYWSRAVMLTLNGAPAAGEEVEGLTEKLLSRAAATVAGPLSALAELHVP